MSKENEKQYIFTRRALVFGGLQLAAFSALAGRLYYLQFVNAEKYTALSENNRIKLQLVAPARGNILDRKGNQLATSDTNYRLFIDYSTITQQSLKNTIEKLKTLLVIPEKKIKALANVKVSTASMPDMIKEHLTWDEVSLIELHMMDLAGVTVDIGQIRYYPMLDEAAHLLGYLGAVTEDELSEDDPPLMRLPDFKIGKNGVEKMLEDRLRGTAGIRQLEVNVHGMPVREIGKTESIAGENIKLTIDSDLQHYAAGLVKNESASVIVMEVATGNLLTMVSLPAFDPNVFSTGISSDYWKELSSDKKSPLLNKAITGQYPPGSTFKMIVGLAALEAKVITPATTVFCPGHFYLGEHKFNCWKEGGHGTVRYHEAIEQSCDTFFYTTAQKLGTEKIIEMAHRFGLGELHDLGLTSEKSGNIPTPDWKMKRFKQRWSGGDTINYAIGQGYVLSTPLQLAVMAARMASGLNVSPRLFVPEGEENPEFTSIGLKPELMRLNINAMSAVVNEPHGTAYAKRISDPRFMMGGKTGTSQVRKILQRGQNQNLLPWEARHHALFVGFAPVDKPKYACCVAIEHGGGGASAAAPVARDVLLRVQQIDAGVEQIPQKTPTTPQPQKTEPPEAIEEIAPDNVVPIEIGIPVETR
jgi:penicillin-binding protein 2